MTTIEWTDRTWNPVRGCSRVSEGCRNCYAERQASRFAGKGLPYEGFAAGGKWTGKVSLIEDKLTEPLHWRKPQRVFVNSMSDLFHEELTDQAIDRVFDVMMNSPHHTFQVLTKRPARMLDYMKRCFRLGVDALPNVWLGVSVEDQATAEERIPLLLQCPAAVRFISAEPLLGPIQLFRRWTSYSATPHLTRPQGYLDWVIVGGESGPRARPCHVGWIRALVSLCQETDTPVFVKQLGSKPVVQHPMEPGALFHARCVDRKGGNMDERPADLRVREFPHES